MAAKKRAREVRVGLEQAPYDLARPEEPAPERMRHDPRIPDQRLTAFWVEVDGERVGRVVMVEFEDVSGWWYRAELLVPGKRKPVQMDAGPFARRKLAVDAVVEAFMAGRRDLRRAS